eukprot:1334940-Heterocapsa_arctica.AAC.1
MQERSEEWPINHELLNGTDADQARVANPTPAGPAAKQEVAPRMAPRTPPATAARGTPPGGSGNGPMGGWD